MLFRPLHRLCVGLKRNFRCILFRPVHILCRGRKGNYVAPLSILPEQLDCESSGDDVPTPKQFELMCLRNNIATQLKYVEGRD